MKKKTWLRSMIAMTLFLGILAMLLTGCLKDCCNDPATPPVLVLTTDTVIAITQTTAQSGGTITSDGGDTITARGVCWSTAQAPTIADNLTSDSIGIGSFTSSITGLTASTTYYVRAYAINRADTAYGNERTFSTLAATGLPILTTAPVTDITQTTATCGGVITSGKGTTLVTERGVCWSTSPNPTTANNKTLDGTGIGAFVSNMTGLTANTTYYVRAYATNSVGTGYGNKQTFSTLAAAGLPIMTTDPVTNITQTTATSGGNITSDGGSPVSERGVCWSNFPNPTTIDSKTSDGVGTGTFMSDLTGLTEGTFYYVRAYATNSNGTSYGDQVTFTSDNYGPPCPGTPTFTYGGQEYNTVQIGTQCWMRENLNIGIRIDGIQEQTNNNPNYIEKYCYNDDEANCDVYGGLYQWGEMVQYLNGASNTTTWNPPPTGNVQGICPPGWHLPTMNEWTALTTFLGGAAGGLMKETGFNHWNRPNTGATNSSGFTALPGGLISFSYFSSLGDYALFWSTTEDSESMGRELMLMFDRVFASQAKSPKTNGHSVRCLKD